MGASGLRGWIEVDGQLLGEAWEVFVHREDRHPVTRTKGTDEEVGVRSLNAMLPTCIEVAGGKFVVFGSQG